MTLPVLWWACAWTLVHTVWIAAVAGGLAWLLRQRLRRAAPRWRHAAALAALVAVAVLPVAIFVGVWSTRSSPAPAAAPPALAQHGPAPAPVALPVSIDSHGEEAVAAQLPSLGLVLDALPALWLAGLGVGLCALALGVVRLRRMRGAARPLPAGALRRERARAARAVGLRHPVEVKLSDRLTSPVATGVRRPVVLLPALVWRDWSSVEVEMVLLHEFAHVRRRDHWIAWLQSGIECALFFHPVVRWVSSWLSLERERCCDAEVVAHTGDPQHYVHTLLALAAPARPAVPAVLAMGRSPLVDRVRSLLNQESNDMTISRAATLTTLGLVALSALIVETQAQEPPKPAECPAGCPAEAQEPRAERRQPPPGAGTLEAHGAAGAHGIIVEHSAISGAQCTDCHAVHQAPAPAAQAPGYARAQEAPPPRATAKWLAQLPTQESCTNCHTPHAVPHGRPAATPSPRARTYVVRKGDTLRRIAQRELGSPSRYRVILDANPGIKPEKLRVGQHLALPPQGARARRTAAPTPPPGSGHDAARELRKRVRDLEQQVEELRKQLERVRSPHKRIVDAEQPAGQSPSVVGLPQ